MLFVNTFCCFCWTHHHAKLLTVQKLVKNHEYRNTNTTKDHHWHSEKAVCSSSGQSGMSILVCMMLWTCTMHCLLMMRSVKSFFPYSMWWQRTMLWCKSHDASYLHSISASNFSESATIEARNAYMFRVDVAVLVYRGVRDRSMRKRILWRLRGHADLIYRWYTDSFFRFWQCGTDDGTSWC